MSEFESGQQDKEVSKSILFSERDPKPVGKEFFNTLEAEQLAQRLDGVFIVLDLLKRIHPEGQGRETYLITLVENGRSWHVFHMLTEWGGSDHIDQETLAAVLDFAIEQGSARDIMSSWEGFGNDVMTEDRLIRLRQAIKGDAQALERFDEKYPNVQDI